MSKPSTSSSNAAPVRCTNVSLPMDVSFVIAQFTNNKQIMADYISVNKAIPFGELMRALGAYDVPGFYQRLYALHNYFGHTIPVADAPDGAMNMIGMFFKMHLQCMNMRVDCNSDAVHWNLLLTHVESIIGAAYLKCDAYVKETLSGYQFNSSYDHMDPAVDHIVAFLAQLQDRTLQWFRTRPKERALSAIECMLNALHAFVRMSSAPPSPSVTDPYVFVLYSSLAGTSSMVPCDNRFCVYLLGMVNQHVTDMDFFKSWLVDHPQQFFLFLQICMTVGHRVNMLFWKRWMSEEGSVPGASFWASMKEHLLVPQYLKYFRCLEFVTYLTQARLTFSSGYPNMAPLHEFLEELWLALLENGDEDDPEDESDSDSEEESASGTEFEQTDVVRQIKPVTPVLVAKATVPDAPKKRKRTDALEEKKAPACKRKLEF